MSRFTSRELHLPVEQDDPTGASTSSSSSSSARPSSSRSGDGSGAVAGGGSHSPISAPLPALPSSLLDALAREPPSSPPNSSDLSSTPRTSLSYSRPFPPSSESPSRTSPSLPSLPPHSPLGFSYSPSAPTTLSERSVSQGSGRSRSSGGDQTIYGGGGAGGRAMRRNLSEGPSFASSSGSAQGADEEFASGALPSNPNPDRAIPPARRSMWKSFGRSPRPSDPGPSFSSSSSSSSRPSPSLATTSSSPISSLLAPAPLHPPSTTEQVITRRPSSTRMRPANSSASGSKWLYEAQAASAAAGAGKSRNGSAGGAGLGLKEHVDDGDTEEEKDGGVKGRPSSSKRNSVRGGLVPAGRGVDAELDAMDYEGVGRRRFSYRREQGTEDEDEEGEESGVEAASPWTGGREQYTHDLLRGAVSDSDVETEEMGTETEDEDEETPDLDRESFEDAPEGEGEGDRTVIPPCASDGDLHSTAQQPPARQRPSLHLDRATPLGDSSLPLPMSPSLVTPRASTSGASVPPSMARTNSGTGMTRQEEVAEGLRQLSMGGGSPDHTHHRKLSAISTSSASHSRRTVSTADFIVAVVGPRHVGKSTVIRRGLKRPQGKPVVVAEDERENRVTTCTSHFTISGQSRTIEVLEIDMALLKYNAEGVIWPEGLPQCEGAMLCYDSTDPRALDSLSLLLQAFWTRGSDIPLIVLACKAQPEASLNATDPNKAAAVCNIYGAGIVALDGGVEDPKKKMKESFNWVIRQIMNNRGEPRRPASSASSSPAESRRGSILPNDPHSTIPQSASTTSALSKPTSSTPTGAPIFDNPFGELSIPSYHGASSSGGAESPTRTRGSRGGSLGLGLSIVQEAPVGSAEEECERERPLLQETEGGQGEGQPQSPRGLAPVVEDGHARNQRLPSTSSNATTSAREGKRVSTSGEAKGDLERKSSHSNAKSSALDLHFSREDMIDKFLFASVTGNDEQYVTLFLIVYRRFARPFEVLTKLIERFDFVAGRLKTDPLLSRFAQMKLCGVLSTWLQAYPGDFTAPATFNLLQPFLTGLLPRGATWVAHYAIELIPLLAALPQMTDPEASWALPDRSLEDVASPPAAAAVAPPPPSDQYRRPSLAPSYDSTASSSAPPSHAPTDSFDGSSSRLSVPASDGSAATPPTTVVHSPQDARHNSSSSDAVSIDTVDSNDPARSFNSSSNNSWKKGIPSASILVDLSNALMELPEDVIAVQITRIAWEAFADMTPRDLMRHVLAPRDPKNPRTALRDAKSNVMQSINFVNYLAEWVATLILVQSKLKWRARILEKFITIAYSLREQENFDSLMGVLAGLNSQPVFRLSETMETINFKLEGDKTKMPKRLRSLNKLMATTKSFSAYRLALANSGANMLPYLGVHLQDITVVNEIKSDMRDGKVNWSKFSQMGRSAAIVLDCSRLAPSLPVDRAVERCILNVPLLDKEKQYALSYSYQPRASSAKPVSSTRRRLKTLTDKLS